MDGGGRLVVFLGVVVRSNRAPAVQQPRWPQFVLTAGQRLDVVEVLDPRVLPVADDQLEPGAIQFEPRFADARVARAAVEVDHDRCVVAGSGKTRSPASG